jgi:hypothetical protein
VGINVNVIFLDVDGVLNIMSKSYITTYFRPDGTVRYLEDHLVQRLNYLIETTGSYLVISSSWRLDMEDLLYQLKQSNFKHPDKIIGATDYNEKYRGEQIQDYLDSNPDIESYVVLEDEPCDVCGHKCDIVPEDKVVQVNMKNGLTHEDIEKAKSILMQCEVKIL